MSALPHPAAPPAPAAPAGDDLARALLPRPLLPEGWPRPSGYANGMSARGRLVLTGGMVGWDADGRFPDGLVAQARRALLNVRAVLAAGGAGPEHLVRLTWYATDLPAYRAALPALGAAYREAIGRHYPAMALVGVTGLVEPAALVEIEATAVVPD